ncbi:MAG: HAD hydrolase-like protein [Azonexus sp.]
MIFDLDGTLVNSFDLFVSIYNSLASRHRIRSLSIEDAERLRHLSPHKIMKWVGMPYWRLPWIARDFVRLMGQRQNEIDLFDGIERILYKLHDQGVQLAVVSSNSLENCQRMLGADICGLMDCIEGGAPLFGKHRRIQRVLTTLGVQPNRAIYVGDQLSDADAARAAGVLFGAVSWGYGAPEALARKRPDVMFSSIEDIGLLTIRQG